MSQLFEGLREGDLENMVLPMLSIDEFDSKIDNDQIIVVAFFCMEENAAHDLSNFIERSPVNVADTDVSPAPNREGYYLTFVEMRRNKLFGKLLLQLLNEVSKLTKVTNWQFTSLLLPKGEIEYVSQEKLHKWVNMKAKPTNNKEKLQEFFQLSSLSDFDLDLMNCLVLSRQGITHQYQLMEIYNNQPPPMAISMDQQLISAASRLNRMLDNGYQVWPVDQGLIVENCITNNYLLLSEYW